MSGLRRHLHVVSSCIFQAGDDGDDQQGQAVDDAVMVDDAEPGENAGGAPADDVDGESSEDSEGDDSQADDDDDDDSQADDVSGAVVFQCVYCGQAFDRRALLNQHERQCCQTSDDDTVQVRAPNIAFRAVVRPKLFSQIFRCKMKVKF